MSFKPQVSKSKPTVAGNPNPKKWRKNRGTSSPLAYLLHDLNKLFINEFDGQLARDAKCFIF